MEISKQNQLTVNQQAQLNLPMTLRDNLGLQSLTNEEKNILSIKYQAKRVGSMTPDELNQASKAMLFRVHTITGWNLPEDDYFLNSIVHEFSLFMSENYPDLNAEEVAYAFRTYGVNIKDWGKNMNLSLINTCLSEYATKRACLSEIEERKTIAPPNPQSIPIVDKEEYLNTVKRTFLNARVVGLIPVDTYEILTQRGDINLTNGEKLNILNRAIKRMEGEALKNGLKAVKEFNDSRKGKRFAEAMRNEAKRQAVAEYFIKQHEIDKF